MPTKFRPCIDLHQGQVKQIVGSSLRDDDRALVTNFTSSHNAAYYADLYQQHQLIGGHVIQLGPGNEKASQEALAAYPQGLQIGGGITLANAQDYLDAGASHVIVTSALFNSEGQFQLGVLQELSQSVSPERLVIDLSCKRQGDQWIVAMQRWQQPTDLSITYARLDQLAPYCDEFLIHAADVEGKQAGMDDDLIAFLGQWGQKPITYAGGASSLADLHKVHSLSQGKVDLTIGSALDIFGGQGVTLAECIAFNSANS